MLAGEAFSPYHHTLLTEREHCSKAVFRFNMTSNDHVQITSEEKHRHFQAVVAAKWIHRTDMDLHYRGAAPPLAGHVGKEVFVDAPFHCDYGYNLIVHDSVTIGPGCRFMDSGRISIGRNSRICANVTIDTQRVPMDSKSVKGSRGTVVAAEVSIGENVYIGANAVILAGVKIGTGAIIHPGSVVMKVSLTASFVLDEQANPCTGHSTRLYCAWQPCKCVLSQLGRLRAH
jgi:acetyltransferase-like isoleucine patch superfamily enzyme